jgi:hypothetical protein
VDYRRATTQTTLPGLPAPIRAAILAKAESTQLTVAADAPAFLTHNVRVRKRRLFGPKDPDAEHHVALVIGARDILVCRHGENYGTVALTCRLEDATVAGPMLAAEGEDGVSITGFPGSAAGVSAAASYYVGLGAPDGEAAKAALTAAVTQAKAD